MVDCSNSTTFALDFKSNNKKRKRIKIRMIMKKMMIAAMMVATLGAVAQNEVGQLTLMPKIGINISSVTGDTNAGYDKKAKVGLVAGAEFEVGLTEKLRKRVIIPVLIRSANMAPMIGTMRKGLTV